MSARNEVAPPPVSLLLEDTTLGVAVQWLMTEVRDQWGSLRPPAATPQYILSTVPWAVSRTRATYHVTYVEVMETAIDDGREVPITDPTTKRTIMSFDALQVAGARVRLRCECFSPNFRDLFLAVVREIRRTWPETCAAVATYHRLAGCDAVEPAPHVGTPANELDAPVRRGATRVEERLNWADNLAKLRQFEGLVSKGTTQQAAAGLVGVALNTLKLWNKREEGQRQQSV